MVLVTDKSTVQQTSIAVGGPVQAVGYGAYQRVQAETSSPGEVIVLLYNALLKNLHRALDALESDDPARVSDALTRAQDITLELRTSLNAETELAEQLLPLYTYLFSSLITANVNKDADLIREVEALVTPIRDAWAFAVQGAIPGAPAAQTEAHRG
jgi:flagellar protein FliS